LAALKAGRARQRSSQAAAFGNGQQALVLAGSEGGIE